MEALHPAIQQSSQLGPGRAGLTVRQFVGSTRRAKRGKGNTNKLMLVPFLWACIPHYRLMGTKFAKGKLRNRVGSRQARAPEIVMPNRFPPNMKGCPKICLAQRMYHHKSVCLRFGRNCREALFFLSAYADGSPWVALSLTHHPPS